MTAPCRVRLERKKGWKKPAGAISVARPSRWGNPWEVGANYSMGGLMLGGVGFFDRNDARRYDVTVAEMTLTAAQAVMLYANDLYRILGHGGRDVADADLRRALRDLAGHDLCCWCDLDQPCHADVLLIAANA